MRKPPRGDAGPFLPAVGLSASVPSILMNAEWMSLLTAALAVAWLLPVGRAARPGGERAAAACFLLSTTLAILLVGFSRHGTEELRQVAVGRTLLFLAPEDVTWLLASMPALVALSLVFARPLSAVAFDRDHARAVGHPVVSLEAGFALSFLALIAIAVPRAGAPFVFAYLTIPAAVAERIVARPTRTVAVASGLAILGVVAGATVAVEYDLPFSTAAAGGALLVALGVGVVALLSRLVLVLRSSRSGVP